MVTSYTRRQFLGYSGIAGLTATAISGCMSRAERVEELEQKVAKYTIERGTNITDRIKKRSEEEVLPVLPPVDFYEGFTTPSKDPFLPPMRVTVHKPRTQNEKLYLSRLQAELDPSDVDNNTYEELVRMGFLRNVRNKGQLNLDFWTLLPNPLPESYKSFYKDPNDTLHGTIFINDQGHRLKNLTIEKREAIKNLYADILRKIVKFYETNAH